MSEASSQGEEETPPASSGPSGAAEPDAERQRTSSDTTSAYARLLAFESFSFYTHLHPSHHDESSSSEEEEDNSLSRHWTKDQLAALWPALSRHSRLRPDAIAAQIGKSTAQVCELLTLLQQQSEQERRRWTLSKQAHFWDSLHAARQVSEAWLAIEEEQSKQLERNEAAVLMRLAVQGQVSLPSSSSSQPAQSHPLDALRPAASLLSPIGWRAQVHSVMLFLRHSLTLALKGNFESLSITDVPVYSLQVANESLCSSAAYTAYARTHPVPQWPQGDAAKDALKHLWSEAERCGFFVSVESLSHRYKGSKTRDCKLRRKLGGRSKLHFVWTDQVLASLPSSSASESLDAAGSDFSTPEEMNSAEIKQRGRSAELHFAQARTEAKLRVLASLNAAELEALESFHEAAEGSEPAAPPAGEDGQGSQSEPEDEQGQGQDKQGEDGQDSNQEEPEQEAAPARPRKKRKIAKVEEAGSEDEEPAVQPRWSAIGIDAEQLAVEAQALNAVAGELLNFGGLGKLLSAQQDHELPDPAQPAGISAPTLPHLVIHLKHFLHRIISHLAVRHAKSLTQREINDALLALAPPLSARLPVAKPLAPHQASRLESARMGNMHADPPVDWSAVWKSEAGTKRLVAGLNSDGAVDDAALHAAFVAPDSASIAVKEPSGSLMPSAAAFSRSASTPAAPKEDAASDIGSDFSSLYEDSEEEAAATLAKRRMAHLTHGVVPTGVGPSTAWKERGERRKDETTEDAKWRIIEQRDEEKDAKFEEAEWRRWTRSTHARTEKVRLRRMRGVLEPEKASDEEGEEEEGEEDASSAVQRRSSFSASASDNEGSLGSLASSSS